MLSRLYNYLIILYHKNLKVAAQVTTNQLSPPYPSFFLVRHVLVLSESKLSAIKITCGLLELRLVRRLARERARLGTRPLRCTVLSKPRIIISVRRRCIYYAKYLGGGAFGSRWGEIFKRWERIKRIKDKMTSQNRWLKNQILSPDIDTL